MASMSAAARGEAMLQSLDERADYLSDVATAASGRLKLIAHVGTIATRMALTLSQHAAKSGYQAISAIPPSITTSPGRSHGALPGAGRYFGPASIVYNFPARTSGFTLPELGELLSHPNIIGIKHTSSDMFQLERIRDAAPDAIVYNGYDEMCLAGFAMVHSGAIGTTYNFMGDLFVVLRACVAAGRIEEPGCCRPWRTGDPGADQGRRSCRDPRRLLGIMGLPGGGLQTPLPEGRRGGSRSASRGRGAGPRVARERIQEKRCNGFRPKLRSFKLGVQCFDEALKTSGLHPTD